MLTFIQTAFQGVRPRTRQGGQSRADKDARMSREAFDIQSVGLPGQPNRTTASRPYKDLGGVPITLSDGTIVLSLLTSTSPAAGTSGAPYAYGTVTTTAATPIKNGTANAQYLVGVKNLSTSAQTATLTIYDNATAGSGTVVDIEPAMAAGALVTFPSPGIPLANGATAVASATPGGSGFQVFVR